MFDRRDQRLLAGRVLTDNPAAARRIAEAIPSPSATRTPPKPPPPTVGVTRRIVFGQRPTLLTTVTIRWRTHLRPHPTITG